MGRPFGSQGKIPVYDSMGYLVGEFNIKLVFPAEYPYCYPIVYELEGKIPREDDWHCSETGKLCITVRPKEILYCRKGITVLTFIKEKLQPYLAVQEYKKEYGEYPQGEYAHKQKGLIQAYLEICKTEDWGTATRFINVVIENKIPGRNDHPCICGMEEKFKNCHEPIIDDLRLIGKRTLTEDLKEITKFLQKE